MTQPERTDAMPITAKKKSNRSRMAYAHVISVPFNIGIGSDAGPQNIPRGMDQFFRATNIGSLV